MYLLVGHTAAKFGMELLTSGIQLKESLKRHESVGP